MNFNPHLNLVGSHAYLSASKYSWLNYSDEKLMESYINHLAVERGTELHELAANMIRLKVNLPRNKKTLNAYVNDAIGYGMTPEQPLYYSENCYGTCDTILFKNNLLRIHDLKTGVTPASMKQLMIYDALFCLEYDLKPSDFDAELRIYQCDEIQICNPQPSDIVPIMDKIIHFDKIITNIQRKEI